MGPVPGPEFADQVAEVALDRFGSQLQADGDFVVVFSGRRPVQDLPFPCCQGGWRGPLPDPPGLALQHGFLQHPANSRLPEGPQGGRLGRARHHQRDGQVRLVFFTAPHQLKAAPLVQVFAHQQQIRPEAVHQLQARRQGGGRSEQQVWSRQGPGQQADQLGAFQTADQATMTQDLGYLGRQPWEKQKGGRLLHAD